MQALATRGKSKLFFYALHFTKGRWCVFSRAFSSIFRKLQTSTTYYC